LRPTPHQLLTAAPFDTQTSSAVDTIKPFVIHYLSHAPHQLEQAAITITWLLLSQLHQLLRQLSIILLTAVTKA
jgi:hypothetical protein